MKKLMYVGFTTAVISMMVTLQCCELINLADEKAVLSIEKKFDLDLFEQNIQAGLGDQWIGYAYVINQEGNLAKSASVGKWSHGDDGNLAANLTTGIYAASVSKMITAVAFLKRLEEKNLNVNAMLNNSIEPFLPPLWNADPFFAQVSFRQVLRHQSGLPTTSGPDYTSVKNAAGLTPANFNYAYSNANYGLMRILMYRLITGEFLTGTDAEMDELSINAFENYVQENVFKPLDIKASVSPSKARYYRWGDPANTAGWDIGARAERLGSGGWYISPVDLAKFLAYLNNTETLITKQTRDMMYNLFLGWSDGAAPSNLPTGEHGMYYSKGGSFCSNGNDNLCIGQGVRTLVVTFPKNKVEVVIMANNRGNNLPLTTMVYSAYDNAWQ